MSVIPIQSAQNEASSSTSIPSSPPSKHIATFVFDSSLPRSKFKRLIVADGAVHKLVQRLMEKHGGETNLRLCLLITASSDQTSDGKADTFRKEYPGPLAFLTSLPTLIEYFPRSGREPLERKWPSFSDQSGEEGKQELIKDRKRKRRIEGALLDGIAGGVQLLDRPYVNIHHSPSRTFISLTPASATPLLDSLYSPAGQNDHTPGSPAQRYLVVVASSDAKPGDIRPQEDEITKTRYNWDGGLDDRTWEGLGDVMKEHDYKCSSVVVGRSDGEEETPSKRLKTMCKAVSNSSFDSPWFSVPSDVDLALSGYSIDTGTTPSLDMASTVATEHIETPLTNPQLSADPKSLQQLQNQAMQARMAQFARAISSAGGSGKVDSQVMQSMFAAMKSGGGNVDMTDPKWQQVRQLLQLQQQRQAASTASISAPLPTPSLNMSNNVLNEQTMQAMAKASIDQNVMMAIQQQRAQQQAQVQPPPPQQLQQQQQPQQQQQQQPQQQQQQQQQQQHQQQLPPAQNPQQPPTRPAQQQIWSGTLSSASQPGNYTTLLKLDASKFSGSVEGIMAQHWPKDLQLRNVVVLDVQTLTAYAQSKSCPIVVFTPDMSGQDNGNFMRYNQLANSLHAKGNMVVIPIGAQDRGIVLFSASIPAVPNTPNGMKEYKLMGVVCLHVPFPSLNSTNGRPSSQNPQQPDVVSQSQQVQQMQQMRQQIPQQLQAQVQAQLQQQQQQQQLNQPLTQQQQQQQYRPSPNAQNLNTNSDPNTNAVYHQQMLLQAQSAMQNQIQPQQLLPPAPPVQQQQQQQQQQYPVQQPQAASQEKRGMTQQQYNQLMLHAQRLGLTIPHFDYNNIPTSQLQSLINGIKQAENKMKAQQAQAQQMQLQQQQQQQNMQMQQQQQMVQLQQMLAQQGQFGAGGAEGYGQ
ncbi:uncharacterized protein IL334_004864 [Kwoniella shivajii]|uniref:Mediator of RNA polymerase II transcription subunit 25 n=1 Tax=Kwoniella shivajii TaxID=564305 RepID=A0ABZ1D1W7_9TREE|nr:hypothetical protein IL334_004864 [Kwoniella shivajii]